MSERPGKRIELDGALNTRDLGGWSTASGPPVRRGVVYRSDSLATLSDADLGVLAQLGIRTVVDLRHSREQRDEPSRLWPGVQQTVAIPLGGQLAREKSFLEQAFDGDLVGLNDDWIYYSYVELLTKHGPEFGRAIAEIIAGMPTLFHCTTGKDRTGLVAMLLLSLAGVDRRFILDDFELTNAYRTERRMAMLAEDFARRGLNVEDYRPALGAPRVAMAKTLDWLDLSFGGPLGFLQSEAGLSLIEITEAADRLRRPH